MQKRIVEYEINGFNPFRNWFFKLTKENQHKVRARLDRIADGNYGNTTNEGGGIIAIRFIKEGLRIYVANVGDVVVILLNAGDKSSKAQQNKDIQKAKEYLEELKSRGL